MKTDTIKLLVQLIEHTTEAAGCPVKCEEISDTPCFRDEMNDVFVHLNPGPDIFGQTECTVRIRDGYEDYKSTKAAAAAITEALRPLFCEPCPYNAAVTTQPEEGKP